MIQSVLNIPEQKMEKIDCPGISSYVRKVLLEVTKILKPFEDATLLLQREKSVSGSMTISIKFGLKKHLDAIKCDYSSKFLSVLKSSLNSCLSHFETDETYQLASMLDPRFKLLWAAQENTDELVSLLQKNASSCDASMSDGEDSDTSPPNKKHKSDDFFNFLPKSTPKRQRHTSERSQLVQRYLDEPTLESSADPLLFWKTNEHVYPTLSKIAKKYLCVPASSAPVERLFSIAGKIFKPDRMQLKDDTFETLMIIKCNSTL